MNTISDSRLHNLVRAMEKLGRHDHLCLIYETREEQFSAVIPFVRIGLARGEKCLYVVDDNTAAEVIGGMKAAGMEVESAVASGQLTIVSKQDAYLTQGYFDPDWMIAFLKQATDEAVAEGFAALRVTGEMTWVLGGDPGTERLMEYEAKLNYFFPENPALAICQYNRNRFSPEIIKDVISTHPLIIYGGMVCTNFYFVPPDDFLGEEHPAREIDRLLANIKSREAVAEELRHHQERLEELVKERTADLEYQKEALEKEIRERRRMEGDLKLVQFAVDHASDCIFWTNPDASFANVNDFTCQRLGYSREELLRLTVFDVDPAFQRQEWAEHWRLIQERHSFTLETKLRTKGGELIPVELTVNYVEYGGAEYNFAFARDITERQQAEEELRRVNEELEQRVKERTRELERRNYELEQMNTVFVGRELRMIELKARIKELEAKRT